MLILRRKAGESLVIGDEITVAVLDINEGSVRLAIDAPKSITILRSELLQAASANRDAADGHASALLKFTERKPVRAFRPSRAKNTAADPAAADGQGKASAASGHGTASAASGHSTTSAATENRATASGVGEDRNGPPSDSTLSGGQTPQTSSPTPKKP